MPLHRGILRLHKGSHTPSATQPCIVLQLAQYLDADATPWAGQLSQLLDTRRRYMLRPLRPCKRGRAESAANARLAREAAKSVESTHVLELLHPEPEEIVDTIVCAHGCVRHDLPLERRLSALPDALHRAAVRSCVCTEQAGGDAGSGQLDLCGVANWAQVCALKVLPHVPLARKLALDCASCDRVREVNALARHLPAATQLRALDLRAYALEHCSVLLSAAAQLVGLECLSLTMPMRDFTIAQKDVLCSAFAALPQLTQLELPICGIGGTQIVQMVHALAAPDRLSALGLQGSIIAPHQQEAVTSALQQLSALTSLSLSYSDPRSDRDYVDEMGGELGRRLGPLVRAVPHLPCLVELDLGLQPASRSHAQYPLDLDADTAGMMQVRLERLTALTALNLSFCRLGEHAAPLFERLATLPRLHSLWLRSAALFSTAADAARLAAAVAAMPALRALDVSSSVSFLCVPEAASYERAMIGAAYALTWLNLEHFGNTPHGVQHVGAALTQLTQLAWLRYSEMTIHGIADARALAPYLSQLTTLQYLDIGGNHVSGEIPAVLGPALAALTGLTELDMWSGDLCPATAAAYRPFSRRLPRLDVARTLRVH